jgi:hypothetical protein
MAVVDVSEKFDSLLLRSVEGYRARNAVAVMVDAPDM